ncbi:EAL domain-containing protein [Egibacter rhizosphaerae]|uniref:EAL domain-containing protein n=1 Tax=Egibacter rhizosphaerae TaxID=1670831 RepID=A0A411YHJ2_9ACTN|nr:EAL domain-containing protein [Egibacter rhizosphaerae]QBI20738.1 EAL domain-containing protein [Egibacter rhizosphaerae]
MVVRIHPPWVVAGDLESNPKGGHRALGAELVAAFGSDAVFQLSAGEYAVLDPEGGANSRAADRAWRAARDAGQRAGLGDRVVSGFSEGQSGDARNPDALWERAEAAAGRAVRDAVPTVSFARLPLPPIPVSAPQTEAVRETLRNATLRVVYEPVVDLFTQQLVGYDVQPRPAQRSELASSSQMLATAQRIGETRALEALTLLTVRTDGPGFGMPADARLFLRVSAAHLDEEAFSRDALVTWAKGCGLTVPRCVVLLDGNPTDTTTERVAELAAAGFQIGVDEVGHPHTPLHLLTSMDAAYVRLDGAFLASVLGSESGRAWVRGVCAAAAEVSATVIAPQLEDEDRLAAVRSLASQPSPVRAAIAGQGAVLGATTPDPGTTVESAAAEAEDDRAEQPVPDLPRAVEADDG